MGVFLQKLFRSVVRVGVFLKKRVFPGVLKKFNVRTILKTYISVTGRCRKVRFLWFLGFWWYIYTSVVSYSCIQNSLYSIVMVPVRNSVPVPTTYLVFYNIVYYVMICIYWHQLMYYSSSIRASIKHCTGTYYFEFCK